MKGKQRSRKKKSDISGRSFAHGGFSRQRSGGGARLRGMIAVSSRGTGYFERPGRETVLIPNERLNTALNRDEVEVRIVGRERGRPLGEVAQIIRRAKTRFVGTLDERGTALVLVPDDFRCYAEFLIPSPPREARRGQKALVALRAWKPGQRPEGAILSLIGQKGEHEAEMRSIVLERGFESEFPPAVEKEARRAEKEISPEEIAKRRDFRGQLLFTIDPAGAKDFDDAISFRKLPTTNNQLPRYEVGIHIADVSHFVREGTALDREARERGTSVYLVDRTVPMLPHRLSDDLCSLNPREDRLAFSAVFEMAAEGEVLKRWFGKTVIRSAKRFTYEEAQEVIDAARRGPTSRGSLASVGEALAILNSLAKKLREEKLRKGAIDFEQDEVGIELDRLGKPVRVFKKPRLDTHRLVEEFMLLANREVAEFFYRSAAQSGTDIPFIYRIHDLPDEEKIAALRAFVRALGHELPVGKSGRVSGRDLQALFRKIEGQAEESLIKTAAVRSMAKAVYSTGNIGHFGLAFEYYTHFTSPIRRYPDLVVHRLLEGLLKGHRFLPGTFAALTRIADHATEREIAASEAERESIKLKQVEFLSQFIGKECEGVISGVTEWGLYIEEKETKAEGMVALRELRDDYYILDEDRYRVVGERTKKKYALGDRVRFRIAGADAERKTLDYRLVP